MKGWYGKKVTVLTALFMVLCLTGFGMLKLEFGPSGSGEGRVLSVIIEHHGVESTEMERTAAIPLEEGLSGISGLSFMRTVSEYGRTRAELTLNKSVSYAKFYLELRDAVEGVYRTMPASFQKPRIVSGRSDDRPVFIVSFGNGKDPDKVRAFVEKEVKPRMEKSTVPGKSKSAAAAFASFTYMLIWKRLPFRA
ncbi:MAG: efflux RND transporter permease subunit [Spirochaetales bacterium]|nr:MAG: efflux RND transporter permease subunit [Spirochaetales bacterium]